MKSKGFTLIELLATITILSVILLITFVSMSSVIKNSKDNLHDNQISQLEKAAEYYNNKEGLKDKNICVSVADLIDKGYIKQDEIIDPKTGKPISGLVKIEYNGKKYSYEYEEKTCPYANYYMNLLEDNEETGLSIGDKYSYQVNDTDTFNFYVLSIEEDKVNLIMDRNICGTNDNNNGKSTAEGRTCLIAWYASSDDNSNGPVTAMEGLYNATKNWTNVPNMVLDYRDEGHIENSSYGYGKIETTEAGIKIIQHQ